MRKRLKSWEGGVWLPILPPLEALLELAVLLGLIALIDWLMPSVDVASLEPSPYWIPVLLLSLQYGTVAGLLAAAAATAAYVLNGFPELGIGENLFTYLLRVWALPILWIGVSLLVGQFRLRQIEVKQELKHQLTQRQAERDSLASYASDLEARCQRLERHMTARGPATGGALLDALNELQDPAANLAEAFGAAARAAFPGGQLSVFAAMPTGFEGVVQAGWPDNAPWRSEIPASDALYRAIVSDRRAPCALTVGDEFILGREGFAAHPIFAPETGRVIGMVKLEHADPQLLTAATVGRLSIIAGAMAAPLAEPRMVVNNDPSSAAAPARLTRGWRHLSWRKAAAAQAGADPVRFPHPNALK